MNILVTGANGQLGNEMRIISKNSTDKYIFTDVNHAVVEKLNATAPENLAKAMKEVDGWLVQISTDYVFGKEPYNTPCKEDQKGTPTGVYGVPSPVTRPSYSVLDKTKIKETFGIRIPYWTDSLKICINNLKKA